MRLSVPRLSKRSRRPRFLCTLFSSRNPPCKLRYRVLPSGLKLSLDLLPRGSIPTQISVPAFSLTKSRLEFPLHLLLCLGIATGPIPRHDHARKCLSSYSPLRCYSSHRCSSCADPTSLSISTTDSLVPRRNSVVACQSIPLEAQIAAQGFCGCRTVLHRNSGCYAQ